MWLRGYNEAIEGYGFDDEDLIARAFQVGFILMKFGGDYMQITDDHRRHVMKNYKNRDWRFTQRLNTLISLLNLAYGRYQTNKDVEWGKAVVVKNFKEVIEI